MCYNNYIEIISQLKKSGEKRARVYQKIARKPLPLGMGMNCGEG